MDQDTIPIDDCPSNGQRTKVQIAVKLLVVHIAVVFAYVDLIEARKEKHKVYRICLLVLSPLCVVIQSLAIPLILATIAIQTLIRVSSWRPTTWLHLNAIIKGDVALGLAVLIGELPERRDKLTRRPRPSKPEDYLAQGDMFERMWSFSTLKTLVILAPSLGSLITSIRRMQRSADMLYADLLVFQLSIAGVCIALQSLLQIVLAPRYPLHDLSEDWYGNLRQVRYQQPANADASSRRWYGQIRPAIKRILLVDTSPLFSVCWVLSALCFLVLSVIRLQSSTALWGNMLNPLIITRNSFFSLIANSITTPDPCQAQTARADPQFCGVLVSFSEKNLNDISLISYLAFDKFCAYMLQKGFCKIGEGTPCNAQSLSGLCVHHSGSVQNLTLSKPSDEPDVEFELIYPRNIQMQTFCPVIDNLIASSHAPSGVDGFNTTYEYFNNILDKVPCNLKEATDLASLPSSQKILGVSDPYSLMQNITYFFTFWLMFIASSYMWMNYTQDQDPWSAIFDKDKQAFVQDLEWHEVINRIREQELLLSFNPDPSIWQQPQPDVEQEILRISRGPRREELLNALLEARAVAQAENRRWLPLSRRSRSTTIGGSSGATTTIISATDIVVLAAVTYVMLYVADLGHLVMRTKDGACPQLWTDPLGAKVWVLG